MGKRREQAPQLEQRHDKEGEDDEEGPQQRLPHPLAEKRKPAQPHASVKALRERVRFRRFRGGRLLARVRTHNLHLAKDTSDKRNLGSEAGESEAHRPLLRGYSHSGSRSLASMSP